MPDTGFTLVEIMIVVAILGIVLATGMPSIVQTFQKEPLRQAVRDMVEALSHARAQAILQGIPAEMVLRASDGRISVGRPQASAAASKASGEGPTASAPIGGHGTNQVFGAQLHSDIAITLLYVNLVDQMQAEEAHVAFYPNGTCDDFTVVIEHPNGVRKISTDPITGLAEVQSIR